MNNLFIDQNWNYKEIIEYIEALKTQYMEILASFSYFDLHKQVEFMKNTRNAFYSFNIEYWKKDKIWEYMNGFEDLEVLKKFIR